MTKNLFLFFLSTVLLLGFQSSIEERLYTLNRDLMCPVCDGLTLEQSQATPALEMKEEIKNHFVAKFGVEILANPPKKGFDTLVWLAPLVFGFFGIVFLYRYIFS